MFTILVCNYNVFKIRKKCEYSIIYITTRLKCRFQTVGTNDGFKICVLYKILCRKGNSEKKL